MDLLYGHDRKLSDFEDPEMTDILEQDMFQASGMGTDSYMDNDWLNSLFEDDPVLNDKMMTDAMQPPCIKSEHSYSIANNDHNPGSPLALGKLEDMDTDIFSQTNQAVELSQKAALIHAAATATQPLKCEAPDMDPLLTTVMHTNTASTTLARPTTIILATTTATTTPAFAHATHTVFPSTTATVQIKQEPVETYETYHEQTVDSMIMPPTPPSSAGSDSDGSQSPQRSAPNSPQRQSPVPHSGVLILSEEEKRTLISEGYPIPNKLPLTKQEEKNLKKVRRKIKNKISAQESRRKKKEYLEALEKRVEAYNHENTDLKKKVESLETNNRSLLGQLQKLQALVSKMPKSAAASATQTGTVLMVLVLCFAMFLGGMGPSSLNVGYTGVGPIGPVGPLAPITLQQPGPLRPQPDMGPGAVRAKDTSDAYSTPNLKSRVLMSLSREESDDWCDDYRPLVPWQQDQSCPMDELPQNEEEETLRGPAAPGADHLMPTVPRSVFQDVAVVTVAVGSEINATETVDEYQAMMHPDIEVSAALGKLGNFSAELETA